MTDLEDMMPSRTRQAQKDVNYILSLNEWNLKWSNLLKQRMDSRGEETGKREPQEMAGSMTHFSNGVLNLDRRK